MFFRTALCDCCRSALLPAGGGGGPDFAQRLGAALDTEDGVLETLRWRVHGQGGKAESGKPKRAGATPKRQSGRAENATQVEVDGTSVPKLCGARGRAEDAGESPTHVAKLGASRREPVSDLRPVVRDTPHAQLEPHASAAGTLDFSHGAALYAVALLRDVARRVCRFTCCQLT